MKKPGIRFFLALPFIILLTLLGFIAAAIADMSEWVLDLIDWLMGKLDPEWKDFT